MLTSVIHKIIIFFARQPNYRLLNDATLHTNEIEQVLWQHLFILIHVSMRCGRFIAVLTKAKHCILS
jgi:hypothetical protein